jgi:hypothetical protein
MGTRRRGATCAGGRCQKDILEVVYGAAAPTALPHLEWTTVLTESLWAETAPGFYVLFHRFLSCSCGTARKSVLAQVTTPIRSPRWWSPSQSHRLDAPAHPRGAGAARSAGGGRIISSNGWRSRSPSCEPLSREWTTHWQRCWQGTSATLVLGSARAVDHHRPIGTPACAMSTLLLHRQHVQAVSPQS